MITLLNTATAEMMVVAVDKTIILFILYFPQSNIQNSLFIIQIVYFPSAAGSIPIKLIKAIPISPVKMKAIPKPRSAGGTLE